MKKILALMMSLMCVAMLFAGCNQAATGSDTGSSTADSTETAAVDIDNAGEINLTLWIGYPEFDEWLAQMSKAYTEKHPNVKIECTSFNLRDVETKLSTALPASSGPDIVSIDPTFFLRFVEGGYARKAPENVAQFVQSDSFDKVIQNFCIKDDVVYSVPSLISCSGIYYNKDMWAEAGLTDADAPKSFEDIRELSKKLAKFDEKGNLVRSGISLRLTGGGSGIGEKFWLWLMQEGHSLVKDMGDGKFVPDYCNEAGLKTMKMYIDIVWGDKTCNADMGSDAAGFEAEQTAMFMREHWVIPDIAKNAPNLNYGVFPLWKAGLIQTNNWYVLSGEKDTVKAAAAWDFIMFMLEPENQALQAKLNGWFSARNNVTVEGVAPEVIAAFSLEGKDVYTYPPLPCNDELQTKLAEKLSTVGWMTPKFYGDDEAIMNFLKECEAESIAILKENGVYGG
ncbi:MAG: extracellular solute-binding protein [Clostridia bacterium]